MDVEERMQLILRPPTEEVITVEELRHLLETKTTPVAYNGFEPSGLAHLGTGLICAYKMRDLIEAGVKVKVLFATHHAWINNKLGGDLEKIRLAAKHFIHAWTACGVPRDKVEYVMADELYDDVEYWNKVLKVARELTIARAKRTLEIAGRQSVEAKKVADLIYTPMQVADIFHLGVDICQLGMDQRKANMVARELGPSLGFWKPVSVHHHLLLGLDAPPTWPLTEEKAKEVMSSIKMSKSKPTTSIFIYDPPEEIRKKVLRAFCPEKEVKFNPILEIAKYIVFRERDELVIEKPAKFGGGKLEYHSYGELEKDYAAGKIHPLDLKNAVAEALIEILKPVRDYFASNKEAYETLAVVKQFEITR